MSRRSWVGAGLVVFGAGIYLTGPTGDVTGPAGPHLPLLSPVAMTAPASSGTALATIQTAVGAPSSATSTPQLPPQIAPTFPSATVLAPPQPIAPITVATPRMINPPPTGAKKAAARPIPAEGPRNGDLPPATADSKPAAAAPKPVEAIVPPLPPTRKAVARLKPAKPLPLRASRVVAKSHHPSPPSRGRNLVVADAAPPPRVPPPPRVQW